MRVSQLKLVPLRRIVQIATFILFVAIPVVNLYGINEVTGTLYSLAIGSLTMSDPLVVMQHIAAAKEIYSPLLLSAIIPILLAVTFGPVFCGWMCPQGFISEIVEAAHPKSRRKANLAVKKGATWIRIKWGILIAGLVAAVVSSLPLLNYVSAPGIITTQLANAVFLNTVGIESLLIAAIILIEILWLRRGWCKVICPIGSTLVAMKTPFTLHLEHNKEHRCNANACGLACMTSCQLDIDPRSAKEIWLCTNCAACVDACPDDALVWTFVKRQHK
jgi:ferredoxin-type protein NapH